MRHRAEEAPRGVEARAHALRRLKERRPHELVAAVHERDDQGPQPPHSARLGVGDRPHEPEVHLRDLARLGLSEAHRRLLLAPAQLGDGVAPEGVVARRQLMVAREQRVDLRQLQRALLREPCLDPLAMRADGLPLVALLGRRTALHALRDLAHLLIRRRAILRQRRQVRRLEVARHRLAVVPRVARDSTRAVLSPPGSEGPTFSGIAGTQGPTRWRGGGSSRSLPRPEGARGQGARGWRRSGVSEPLR